MLTISAQVFQQAQLVPEKTALIVDGDRRSFAELERNAATIAGRLQAEAGRRPLRVALALEDSAVFVEVLLACLGTGHVIAIADPDWPAETLARNIEDLRFDILIAEADKAEALARAVAPLPVLSHGGAMGSVRSLKSWTAEAGALRTWPDVAPTAPFLIGFTSGSTGQPKAFIRDQSSWATSFAASDAEIPTGADDVLLCPGLMKHTLGLYAVLYALARGATALCSRRFGPAGPAAGASEMLDLMDRHDVTQIALIPPMAHWMADAAHTTQRSFDTVRQVTSTAMKLAVTTRQALQEVLPNADIVEYYGAAESGFISISKPAETPPLTSVGRAMSGVELSLRDPDTGHAVPVGEAGQVHIRSHYVSNGYLVERDAGGFRHLSDGWATVGDIGVQDARGMLTIVGRENDLMVSGGHKVYPAEIETVLANVDGLQAACVLGLRNPVWGDVVCVVSSPVDVPTQLIAQSCLAVLPPERCPQVHIAMADLPRTSTGKIARSRLHAYIEETHGAAVSELTMDNLRQAQRAGAILGLRTGRTP
ncbi:class I adenylate-forming enzyme family protein [Thalassococcus sp. S3]|uniref:class I adenylate-forming enzyme family protein n=1 Tax=Thalassococcus sp. S3 TaxID=2017482 RepID=UPI0010246665|nr:AMP-binding protein [Thalassococcus sp. S3]QBF29653.1 hypothetical protein CFI11_00285 [Thalassococcus sp. S3]